VTRGGCPQKRGKQRGFVVRHVGACQGLKKDCINPGHLKFGSKREDREDLALFNQGWRGGRTDNTLQRATFARSTCIRLSQRGKKRGRTSGARAPEKGGMDVEDQDEEGIEVVEDEEEDGHEHVFIDDKATVPKMRSYQPKALVKNNPKLASELERPLQFLGSSFLDIVMVSIDTLIVPSKYRHFNCSFKFPTGRSNSWPYHKRRLG
jgi:hypothetical protein